MKQAVVAAGLLSAQQEKEHKKVITTKDNCLNILRTLHGMKLTKWLFYDQLKLASIQPHSLCP